MPSAALPVPSASLPAKSSRTAPQAFGEIDLPLLPPEAPMLSASLPVSHGGLSGPPMLSAAPPVLSAPLPTAHSGPGAGPPQRAATTRCPSFRSDRILLRSPMRIGPSRIRCSTSRVRQRGVSRAAGGGASFGEVSLGDDQEAAIGEETLSLASGSAPPVSAEDDMEFGGIPQEAEVGRSLAPALAPAAAPSRKPAAHVSPSTAPSEAACRQELARRSRARWRCWRSAVRRSRCSLRTEHSGGTWCSMC